jgi:hypothetical protein
VADTNEKELITGMINRSLEQMHYKETIPFGEEIIRTEHLTGQGFEDVSLKVRAGEVIGLYGLIAAACGLAAGGQICRSERATNVQLSCSPFARCPCSMNGIPKSEKGISIFGSGAKFVKCMFLSGK